VLIIYVIILPDFRFSGGLMTRDLERLTRNDRRLTSRKNVEARSCILDIGLLVGVTQYCAANILFVFVFVYLTSLFKIVSQVVRTEWQQRKKVFFLYFFKWLLLLFWEFLAQVRTF
jgi:hypothetical protein